MKEEKIANAFYGNSKTWPIAELEGCHPVDVAYEISSQSKTSWSVTQSSWNVGDINTSHFVSFLNEDESICKQDSCEVKCSKCPIVQYCVHHFNCTCSEFATKRVCAHIHVIIMNDLIGKNEQTEVDQSVVTNKPNDVEKKQTTKSHCNDQPIDTTKTLIEEKVQTQDSLTSCAKVSMKEEAKSYLWSLIRYVDELPDSSETIQDVCNKIVKTGKTILTKDRQMTCRIGRVINSKDVIKKIVVSDSLKDTHSKEDSPNFDLTQKSVM